MADPGDITITPAIRRWAMLGWAQQNGRSIEYWQDVIERDPMLTRAVMVIEMVFGGYAGGATVVRVATVPLRSLSGISGIRHNVQPKLLEEPELTQSYQFGVANSQARSIVFTLDPLLIDPLGLILAGYPLAGVAEVSLEHLDGADGSHQSDHDRRLVLMRGDIDGGVRFGPSSGPDREPMEVEVVDPVSSTSTKLPPWVLDSSRHTGIHTSAVGTRMPIVLNGFGGVPALRVTSVVTGGNEFLFAFGHGFTVSASTGVLVNGVLVAAADVVYAWVLLESIDSLGKSYSSISFTVGATVWEDSDAVHVVCSRPSDDLDVIGIMRRVIEDHSALGIDGTNAALFAEAAARFPVVSSPNVLINGSSGASAATCLEWIEGGYLQALPMISMVWDGGAYGPVVTDHRLTPQARWEVGKWLLLDRISMVEETSKSQIRNDFVVRYDWDPVEDVFRQVGTRNPTNSDLCRYSDQMFGQMDAEPIEAPYFDDPALVEYILDWQVEHFSLPSYLVQYSAMSRVLLEYRRGDTIELTDTELGFTDVRATIEAISYKRGQCEVTLRVWARYLDLGGQALSV